MFKRSTETMSESFKTCNKQKSSWYFLGIPAIDQDIIKNVFPCDTVKQSYQMLCEWFINCKPEERTVETLRRGFKDAECFAALEYLSLDERVQSQQRRNISQVLNKFQALLNMNLLDESSSTGNGTEDRTAETNF
ncbi:Hypothetical predicted protein [Octopus vulgaris]|uniref:Death domain-containing protein n=1 Tax=Octopus vulgaris TaxID=6645 RepID=A0AA36HHF4_OCTVU|nr:Hypothetical predicted protein [Octopus vulgaris]